MFPIFFSVSSRDILFAERVWDNFPADWIYLYSRSGEEGAHMWDEISQRELPKSKILVIFWSGHYLTAEGCVREILQARDLVSQGAVRPVVLRLDDTPISWGNDLDAGVKPVFEALREMLAYRTSSPNVTEANAIEIVGRAAEPILKPQHPILLRHDILATMRRAVQKDRFTTYPAVWVSGFNGIGRETIVREFNRSFVPNGRGVLIDVNESSLPRQVLMRISSEAFGANLPHLQKIASDPTDIGPIAVAQAVQEVFQRGDYVIFRHNRIVEDNVELPEWLDDVVIALSPAARCKMFVISQLPLLAERRARCSDGIVSQRVTTVDEYHMIEFCNQLVGYFDSNPVRWTDADIARIVRASSGTLGFLVSLVRSAANLGDLDQIDTLAAVGSERIVEAITVYVRWAFAQLSGQDDEQKTLLFLDNVTPCHVDDLGKAVAPKRPIVRVLGRLSDLGLVEREVEGVYRLTPLLANRLNRNLIQNDLLRWLEDAMRAFASRPIEVSAGGEEDEHEYLRLESRIQAALLSDGVQLSSGALAFVSASHWFQAGIRLHHRRHHAAAYRILKMAYQQRSEFSNASRVELMRYFCLSATRNRNYPEAEACITLLDGVHTTKAIAAFLRADLHEYKREFPDAIKEYEMALDLNKGKDSRQERTYRPLIRCIIATHRPDFKKAEGYAIIYRDLRRTVFSLSSLARVYLHWKYRGEAAGRSVPDDIDNRLLRALEDLENDPGAASGYYEVRSEEAEFKGDFPQAISYMDQAVAADGRFQLRSERWRLMVRSGRRDYAEQVLREMDVARNVQDLRSNWLLILSMLAETYVRALRVSGQPFARVNAFAPELSSDEIGRIIGQSNRQSYRTL